MSNTTELLNTIESSLSQLSKKVEGIEVLAYENILKNIKDLDYNSSGALIQNANNTKVLGSMKAGINKLVNSPGYIGAVKTFGKSYDIVGAIQNDYFEDIVKDFKPSGAVKIVRNTAVSQMVDNLIGGGVNQEVTQKAGNILLRNIQSGSNVRQVTEELRGFMITTSETTGALSKYSGQIATDAINQYAAAYNEQVIDDLGFEWYQYVGSIRDTTRPWCVHLVNQRYIHKSELAAAANGNFRGVKVSVAGLYPNTNGTNLPVLRGGYNCKHQLRGVATENVPLSIREKVIGDVKN